VTGSSEVVDEAGDEKSSDPEAGESEPVALRGGARSSARSKGDLDGVCGSSCDESEGDAWGLESDESEAGNEDTDLVSRVVACNAIAIEQLSLHRLCGRSSIVPE